MAAHHEPEALIICSSDTTLDMTAAIRTTVTDRPNESLLVQGGAGGGGAGGGKRLPQREGAAPLFTLVGKKRVQIL